MEQLRFKRKDFHEILHLRDFRIYIEKIQDLLKSMKINYQLAGYFMHVFDHISLNSFIVINILDECCRENQITHFMLNNFFFHKNRAFYKIVRKSVVEPDRPQMAVRHLLFACWITKATNTDSEYVIFIALPSQKCLRAFT